MIYGSSWEEKQALDAYEDSRELNKAAAKAAARENARLQAYQARQQMKEMEEERKRAIFEEILVSEKGDILVVTRNLSFDAMPRLVTNLRTPALTVLKRVADAVDQAYLITGAAGNREIELILDARRAGEGTYLLKKFGAVGVCFEAAQAVSKRFSVHLIALLLQMCSKERWLADQPGWVKIEGQDILIEEGDLTWEIVKKRMK